jgi:Icc-related predicted phosphoesterase
MPVAGIDMAFERPNDERDHLLSQIPANIDILVTHTPPRGIGDFVSKRNLLIGDEILLRHVTERIKPKYHVFGHNHEGHGFYYPYQYGDTIFANAAVCTNSYKPRQLPLVF